MRNNRFLLISVYKVGCAIRNSVMDITCHSRPMNNSSCTCFALLHSKRAFVDHFLDAVPHGFWDEQLSSFEQKTVVVAKLVSDIPV